MEIALDQSACVSTLRSIACPQLTGPKPEDECCPVVSLFGVVAYLARARPDVVVFMFALQRYTHKPQIQRA
eukprot:8977168-Lingulodinium_polyedra.AAC.1